MLKQVTVAGGVLVVALISGCGSDVIQPHMDVSIGQQLIDLKKARDAGALTDSEFKRKKEQLIDSVR